MNRRLLPLASLLLAAIPVLSSCAVVDLLGPRPNADLLELAEQATIDEHVLADVAPELAALRGEQATALYAEIERLCGRDQSGELPETCAVDTDGLLTPETDTEPAEVVLERALAGHLAAGDEVPAESVDLVTIQSVELAGADEDTELDELPMVEDEDDLEAARALLEQEFAAEYGLGVARAFIDPVRATLLDTQLQAHRERILALQAILSPTGELPLPQAGYEFSVGPVPEDSASAAEYAAAVGRDATARWQTAASAAESEPWREFSVNAAAHAVTAGTA